jgi:hypothetical protein
MIVLFHVPVAFAVATSQFVLMWMAGGGTIVHLASGTLTGDPLRQAIALGAGAVVGAQFGAVIARRLSGAVVLRMLALALVLLAGRLIVKAVFQV